MTDKFVYEATEIDNVRTIIGVLYLSSELHKLMSPYEKASLNEKMLQTYLAQGIRYNDLQLIFQKQLGKDKENKN